MSQSSTAIEETTKSTGIKWKNRLFSKGRRLSTKKVTIQDGKNIVNDSITLPCNRCKKNKALTFSVLNSYSSNSCISICDKNEANTRQGQDFALQDNIQCHNDATCQQSNAIDEDYFNNDFECENKRQKNGKCMHDRRSKGLFSTWFKTSRHKRGSLSSNSKFNEPDNNFKLLRDVKMLRDPDISSSEDSLELEKEKYYSLKRSRACLIDIKWDEREKSEKYPTSHRSKRHSLNVHSTEKQNNYKTIARNTISRSDQKNKVKRQGHKRLNVCTDESNQKETSVSSQKHSTWTENFRNRSDNDEVVLTAEERSFRSSSNLDLELNDQLATELHINLNSTNEDQTSEGMKNVSVSICQSEIGISNHTAANQVKMSNFEDGNGEVEANEQNVSETEDFRRLSLSQLADVVHNNPIMSQRCVQCKSERLSQPMEDCHDVLITRRPQKPAPKPPFLIKNKSQSLMALAGKLPVLSDQLDFSGTTSLRKLNDSCSENLCELLSQSKDALSSSSKGVFMGIVANQGVILKKRDAYTRQKRTLSMPPDILENVMEAEVTEQMANRKSYASEIEKNRSESKSTCNSHSLFFPYTTTTDIPNSNEMEEVCFSSVCEPSMGSQDANMKKSVQCNTFTCLVLNDPINDFQAMESRENLYNNVNDDTTNDNVFLSRQAFPVVNDATNRHSPSVYSVLPSCLKKSSQDFDDDSNDKVRGKPLMYAEALWDHVTMNEEELCFTAGQAIAVYDVDDPQWWFGIANDNIGWFPATFVWIPVSADLLSKYESNYKRNLENANEGFEIRSDECLSNELIRDKILEEIVNTERDYVKNLHDIIEGFLKQARKRTDMFNETLLMAIFSNIEKIYFFHLDFFHSIKREFDQSMLHKEAVDEIGAVFLQNREKFELYSEYCKNHERATSELKNLLQQDKYKYFFEACRMLREMIQISLDGFLLTPVQKICKYPLQLQELLKYTSPEHKDYNNVRYALEAMREVASSINEKKRKVDNIKKIAEWQLKIDQWQGEDVLVKSSQLVHSGEVSKISKGKIQNVTLFLFDHQLIYCKKDLIKKRSMEWKGRIILENYKFEKLEDGEVCQNGVLVKNSWRLSSKHGSNTCIFHAKTSELRDKWIGYFLQERKIVYETTSANSIPLKERLAAMEEARSAMKKRKQLFKCEKNYGNFTTANQKRRETYCINENSQSRIKLPHPVSSTMLFSHDRTRTSLRRSKLFKKRKLKPQD